MKHGAKYFDFFYDANGTAAGFAYRQVASSAPTYYYYGVNTRGDIEVIYNSSGLVLAKYKYDAYGKLLNVTNSADVILYDPDSIAHLNPLRYRSYVYDNESGLYYLQARYYDPTTCRFINSDPAYISTGQGINGHNMFAYCNNNPVMYSDPTGCCAVHTYYYMPSCPGCNSELADLHAERGPDWANTEPDTSEPNFFEKVGQTFVVIYNSAYVEAGTGFGLGGSFGTSNISINGVVNSDLVHAKLSSDGFEFGMDCNISFGPNLFGIDIPALTYNYNYNQSYLTDTDDEYEGFLNDFVIVDLSSYLIGGITFTGGWDGQKIFDGLSDIW